MVQPLWKTGDQLLTKLNKISAYDSEVILLGIYSTDLKSYVHTESARVMIHMISPFNSPCQNQVDLGR